MRTDEQVNNLKKLADYLGQPQLKARFDITKYAERVLGFAYKTECGSVGCAIGHGPYAGIEKLSTENWDQYCSRAFGVDSQDDESHFSEFEFLFSCSWKEQDNTSIGAKKRIEYLLKNGCPSRVDTEKMQFGGKELCY